MADPSPPGTLPWVGLPREEAEEDQRMWLWEAGPCPCGLGVVDPGAGSHCLFGGEDWRKGCGSGVSLATLGAACERRPVRGRCSVTRAVMGPGQRVCPGVGGTTLPLLAGRTPWADEGLFPPLPVPCTAVALRGLWAGGQEAPSPQQREAEPGSQEGACRGAGEEAAGSLESPLAGHRAGCPKASTGCGSHHTPGGLIPTPFPRAGFANPHGDPQGPLLTAPHPATVNK